MKLKQGHIGTDLSQKLEATLTFSLLILKTSVFASPRQWNSFVINTGLMLQVIIRTNRTAILRLLFNSMQPVNQQQELNVLRFN